MNVRLTYAFWSSCVGFISLFFGALSFNREAYCQEPTTAKTTSETIGNDKKLEDALAAFGRIVDQRLTPEVIDQQRIPAAAAALHRRIAQLSSDQRYEALSQWTLPTADRNAVRLIAIPVPVDAPPKAFARAIGERPRDESFAIAEVGCLSGFFCPNWMLVQAADELGTLSRLTVELEKLSADGVPGAAELLLFAIAKNTRADATRLQAALAKIIADNQRKFDPLAFLSVAIAASATERPELIDQSVAAMQSLALRTGEWQPFLRVAVALAMQKQLGKSAPSSVCDLEFKHWASVTGGTALQSDIGLPRALWLSHEQHLLHAAGRGEDTLYFRYPLTGDFDFTCETQAGGAVTTDGGLVYGGLHFEPVRRNDRLNIFDCNGQHHVDQRCPFIRHEDTATFNRLSIRGSGGQLAMETNFHSAWFFGDAAKSSPWVGLRSAGKSRPIFRNLKILGSPTIPREVSMIADQELRGWSANFFGNSVPAFNDGPPVDAKAQQAADWTIHEGVLTATAPTTATATAIEPAKDARPSWLRYERPLWENETVQYEFKHATGNASVHPAIGRMVFLLEEGGIRVRWITNRADDWTGLKPDHGLLEPLSRRGPKPLPFKPNAWNQVAVKRVGGHIDVLLNEQLVYHREVDFTGDMQFGFYRSEANDLQIRDAKLTGDWPETLPANCFEEPFQLSVADLALKVQDVPYQSIGDSVFASNSQEFRRRVAILPVDKRFDRLRSWVLPTQEHRDVRITGFFEPTNPSPLQEQDLAFAKICDDAPVTASLFSPARDLFVIADSTGRMNELRAAIEQVHGMKDISLEWSKQALSCLLACQTKDQAALDAALYRLIELKSDWKPSIDAECVVAHAVAEAFPKSLATLDYVASLHQRHVKSGDLSRDVASRTHLMSIDARVRHLHSQAKSIVDTDRLLAPMISTFDDNAKFSGDGTALPLWRMNQANEVQLVAGHPTNRLFYPCPLTGDYTIEADLISWGTTGLVHAAETIQPQNNGTQFGLGVLVGKIRKLPIEPAVQKPQQWVRYRQQVLKNHSTVFLNGRLIHERELSENDDPWLSVQGWWSSEAGVRDLSVSGSPVIPNQLLLTKDPSLTGWFPYDRLQYWTEMLNWKSLSGEAGIDSRMIFGKLERGASKSSQESLLQYYRPLVENGSIEFDYFYEPGVCDTAPAIGRMALLIEPDGVVEHWVTDGKYDRTGVRPDHRIHNAEYQKHTGTLPLKIEQWNHVRLELTADSVAVSLNEQLVYERPLVPLQNRKFGLFYFADKTETRVQQVVLRGEWPKEIPVESTLADPLIAVVEKHRATLPVKFEHRFNDPGRTETFFRPIERNVPFRISQQDDGLNILLMGQSRWTDVALTSKFSLQGDFDVEAEFKGLNLKSESIHAGPRISIDLSDEFSTNITCIAGCQNKELDRVAGILCLSNPDGSKRYQGQNQIDESSAGRLRIVRVGKEIFCLFSQGGSPRFRLLCKYETSTADVPLSGLRLLLVEDGGGQAQVTWTAMKIAADKMLRLDEQNSEMENISIIDLSTGAIQEVTKGTAAKPHIGSQLFSPDGTKLAHDGWTKTLADATITVADLKTGQSQDIGGGMMPSFSADGKLIAFSSQVDGLGICNVDGTNRQIIDRQGWGLQWSPSPNIAAYNKSGNLYIWDSEKKTSTPLLTGAAAQRYNYFYWNMAWSRDGRKIAFKGQRRDDGQDEFAVVSLDKPSVSTLLLDKPSQYGVDFSWSEDDQFVLVGRYDVASNLSPLYKLAAEGNSAPIHYPVPAMGGKIKRGTWSRDNKFLAVSFQVDAKLVKWVGDEQK